MNKNFIKQHKFKEINVRKQKKFFSSFKKKFIWKMLKKTGEYISDLFNL